MEKEKTRLLKPGSSRSTPCLDGLGGIHRDTKPKHQREIILSGLQYTTLDSPLQERIHPVDHLLQQARARFEAAQDDSTWTKHYRIWRELHRLKVGPEANHFELVAGLRGSLTAAQEQKLIGLATTVGRERFRQYRKLAGVAAPIPRLSKGEAGKLIRVIMDDLEASR